MLAEVRMRLGRWGGDDGWVLLVEVRRGRRRMLLRLGGQVRLQVHRVGQVHQRLSEVRHGVEGVSQELGIHN